MNWDLAAFCLLFQENKVVRRLYVFVNVIRIRNNKLSVQINIIDKNITINVTIGQLTTMRFNSILSRETSTAYSRI